MINTNQLKKYLDFISENYCNTYDLHGKYLPHRINADRFAKKYYKHICKMLKEDENAVYNFIRNNGYCFDTIKIKNKEYDYNVYREYIKNKLEEMDYLDGDKITKQTRNSYKEVICLRRLAKKIDISLVELFKVFDFDTSNIDYETKLDGFIRKYSQEFDNLSYEEKEILLRRIRYYGNKTGLKKPEQKIKDFISDYVKHNLES